MDRLAQAVPPEVQRPLAAESATGSACLPAGLDSHLKTQAAGAPRVADSGPAGLDSHSQPPKVGAMAAQPAKLMAWLESRQVQTCFLFGAHSEARTAGRDTHRQEPPLSRWSPEVRTPDRHLGESLRPPACPEGPEHRCREALDRLLFPRGFQSK